MKAERFMNDENVAICIVDDAVTDKICGRCYACKSHCYCKAVQEISRTNNHKRIVLVTEDGLVFWSFIFHEGEVYLFGSRTMELIRQGINKGGDPDLLVESLELEKSIREDVWRRYKELGPHIVGLVLKEGDP